LEVIDNGSGIAPANFDFLAKPHSTSKLSSFTDFDHLLTFGFRGEALNALAALR
jgi:DNA mismatch repair protein PMS2